ncbi:MAG: hypothetical protein JXR21_06040 [Candidatus Marinimicrobia bacterium]|nr:hypothetical protein [Candidatus Neomarinimicrobiota bacterium]
MIERMSKITLLVDEGRSKETLKDLRKLGVLHVRPLQNPPSGDMSAIGTLLENARNALAILGDTAEIKQKNDKKPDAVISRILEIRAKRDELLREQEMLKDVLSWYDAWSRVSLEDLIALEKDGCYIRLYRVPPAEWKELSKNGKVFLLEESKTALKIAFVSDDPDEALDYRPVALPELSHTDASARLKETGSGIEAGTKELARMKSYAGILRDRIAALEKEHQFAAVQNGLGLKEEIAYLQGFVPADEAAAIETAAAKHGWGYVEEEPELTDNPPTKLKNAKWIRIIQPVFDFLGTVPGYREKDISMFFLIFFSVFVAMIIGDAGYGTIFFLGAVFATVKTRKSGGKMPLAVILLYVLSIATMTWGAITGTWFGSAAIAGIPFFKAMIIPEITSFPEVFPGLTVNPQDRVMLICFILAVIQLGLASIINFIENLPRLKAFEHAGWFALTVGLFTLVLNLVLGMAMPAFALPLIGAGFAGIVIFGKQEPGKNFFKGILSGFGGAFNTFLDAISSFSNIISYIRLFAVGMASVAIASSFNDIAAPMMHGPAIVAGVVVLLIGHGLNIVMGLLSVIVHGIRLNMLEFSGQLGLEWTGYKYEPFNEK